jgi:hypothetical protein
LKPTHQQKQKQTVLKEHETSSVCVCVTGEERRV